MDAAVEPVRVGVAGVGGYGGRVVDLIGKHGPGLAVPLEVAAGYEAFADRAPQRLAAMASSGVAVTDEYAQMLAMEDVDAVWLAVPIHLHRAMTAAALEAGKAVMCEKPAAGSTAEVDAMAAASVAADRLLLIGFQEVYDPMTRWLKGRLLDGAIGEVRRVSVRGCWPRGQGYFQRSDWAGRRTIDGAAVHDSPLGNAMAHFVNLALLFAGVGGLDEAARPVGVEATLGRVNAIESFDTVSLRCATDCGPEVLVWLTHACGEQVDPVIEIEGSGGRVRRTMEEVRVKATGAEPEVRALVRRDCRPMLEAFGLAARGLACEASILATPSLARPHVELVERLAAMEVRTAPEDAVATLERDDGVLRALPGIEDRFAEAQRLGRAPVELW